MASPSAASGSAKSDPCSLSSSSCDATWLQHSKPALRCVAIIASISVLVFLMTDKQTSSFTIYTSTVIQEVMFSDMKALVASITLGISRLQILVRNQRKKVTIITHLIGCDDVGVIDAQVMTYLILSIAAASAQFGRLCNPKCFPFPLPLMMSLMMRKKMMSLRELGKIFYPIIGFAIHCSFLPPLHLVLWTFLSPWEVTPATSQGIPMA
ncbi:hypothetical protein GOP47_0002624 [Adiantum capillus-veneris]|uniref:Uncharacterized protein n=1 Tax=Adiantum capillus-veneris TaxID=13818 RepID=A0A9D4VBY6_ADICA|nr:hypothetical protein GOP47_0002624 [Adiantum capillus-veneris]